MAGKIYTLPINFLGSTGKEKSELIFKFGNFLTKASQVRHITCHPEIMAIQYSIICELSNIKYFVLFLTNHRLLQCKHSENIDFSYNYQDDDKNKYIIPHFFACQAQHFVNESLLPRNLIASYN